jgi:phage terminase Nu1 subunit (DNA packaging protein)
VSDDDILRKARRAKAVSDAQKSALQLKKLQQDIDRREAELQKFKEVAAKHADTDDSVRLSMGEIAAQFGVHKHTVEKWNAAGCPREKKPGKNGANSYRLSEVRAWLEQEGRTGIRGGDQVGRATGPELREILTRARIRVTTAQAEKHEEQLKLQRGAVVDKADVDRQRLQEIEYCRRKWLSLPARLAPQIVDMKQDDVEELLDKEVRDMLRTMGADA